jgi:subtilisin family serine protease
MDDNEENDLLEPDILALLRDTSLWQEPSAKLEDRVVAAIADERRVVVPIGRARRAWPGRLTAAAIGAAAAAAVVLIAVPRNEGQQADASVAIAGTQLAPGISGTAAITSETSGVRIQFSVKGLPRRDGGDFYEGWLKNCAGTELVPIGTYHELDNATGWAGVSINDFPLLTVTREHVAAPKDAAQGSSGEVVVSGVLAACPA